MQRVRAVSLDVTGTMLVHKAGVYASYAAAAKWAGIPAAPTAAQFKPAFKQAYQDTLATYPCYGHGENMSSKQWWRIAVKAALDNTLPALEGAEAGSRHQAHPCTEAEFDRFFRRIYQHYGSPEGYSILYVACSLFADTTDGGLRFAGSLCACWHASVVCAYVCMFAAEAASLSGLWSVFDADMFPLKYICVRVCVHVCACVFVASLSGQTLSRSSSTASPAGYLLASRQTLLPAQWIRCCRCSDCTITSSGLSVLKMLG